MHFYILQLANKNIALHGVPVATTLQWKPSKEAEIMLHLFYDLPIEALHLNAAFYANKAARTVLDIL